MAPTGPRSAATKPGVTDLLEILGAGTGEPAAEAAGRYPSDGALKRDTADAVVALLEPVQHTGRPSSRRTHLWWMRC